MSYELSNEEKIAILEQHLKNVASSIYNLEISLLAENSISSPHATTVEKIISDKAEQESRKTALLEELDNLKG